MDASRGVQRRLCPQGAARLRRWSNAPRSGGDLARAARVSVSWEMYISRLTESDLQLRQQFETRALANGAFRHREHVRLTWIYLTGEPADQVVPRLCESLLALATLHGVPERFHHTLTVAWVRIIDDARRAHPDLPFDALVDACPMLLDKDAPLAFYSRDHLFSEDARKFWVEPNLQPLPGV
jgi:hypothetical protein